MVSHPLFNKLFEHVSRGCNGCNYMRTQTPAEGRKFVLTRGKKQMHRGVGQWWKRRQRRRP